MGFNEIYNKMRNVWYNITNKIGLGGVVEKIDTKVSSFNLFLIILVLIIILIVFLIILNPFSSQNIDVELNFKINGRDIASDLPAIVSINSETSNYIIENGIITLEGVREGSLVKIIINTDSIDYTTDFIIDKSYYNLNIERDELINTPSSENRFLLTLMYQSKLYSLPFELNIKCEDESEYTKYTLTNSRLELSKTSSCSKIDIRSNPDGFMPISKKCSPGTCIVNISNSEISDDTQNLIQRGNIVVYTTLDGSSVEASLSLENENEIELDNDAKSFFGNYLFSDVAFGTYYVQAKYGSTIEKRKVDVNSLNDTVVRFDFNSESIGSITIDLESQDREECQGKIMIYENSESVPRKIDANCSNEYKYDLYSKGEYLITFIPDSEYSEEYMKSEDVVVEVDSNSFFKKIYLEAKKIATHKDTKLNVYVKTKGGEILENINVLIEDADTGNKITDIKKTDTQGYSSFIVSPGNYRVRAFDERYDNFNDESAIRTYEREDELGAPILEKDVNLEIDRGTATINVESVVDSFGDSVDLDVQVYINNLEEVNSIYNKTNYSLEIPGFNDVYTVLSAPNFMSYISYKRFLQKGDEFDIETQMELSENYSGNPEVEFKGIFDEMSFNDSSKVDNILSNNRYYYGFRVIVPKDYAQGNDDDLYFILRAGDERSVQNSPIRIERVFAPEDNYLYKNISGDLADELTDNLGILNVTKTKRLDKGYIFDVFAQVKIMDANDNTPITLSYELTNARNKKNPHNIVRMLLGDNKPCSDDVCIVGVKDEVSTETLDLAANTQESFDVKLTFGEEFEDGYRMYEGDSQDVFENESHLYISSMDIFEEYFGEEEEIGTLESLRGPLFLEDDERIRDSSKRVYSIEGQSGLTTKLSYDFFNSLDTARKYIDIQVHANDKISLNKGESDIILVPNVSNPITLEFKSEKYKEILNAVTVKVYIKDNINPEICDTKTVNSGEEFFVSGSCVKLGNTTIIEFSKEGYETERLEFDEIDEDYLENIEQEFDFSVPKESVKTFTLEELENNSLVEFEITDANISYISDDLFYDVFYADRIKQAFIGKTIYPKINNQDFNIDIDYNFDQIDTGLLLSELEYDVQIDLTLEPKGLEELSSLMFQNVNTRNLIIDSKFTLTPDFIPEGDCLKVGIYKEELNPQDLGSDDSSLEINYLEEGEIDSPTIIIRNNCDMGSYNFESIGITTTFEGTNTYNLTIVDGEDTKTLTSGSTIYLKTPERYEDKRYVLDIERIVDNMEESTDITFNIFGNIIQNESVINYQGNTTTLTLNKEKLSQCLELSCASDGKDGTECPKIEALDYEVYRLPYDLVEEERHIALETIYIVGGEWKFGYAEGYLSCMDTCVYGDVTEENCDRACAKNYELSDTITPHGIEKTAESIEDYTNYYIADEYGNVTKDEDGKISHNGIEHNLRVEFDTTPTYTRPIDGEYKYNKLEYTITNNCSEDIDIKICDDDSCEYGNNEIKLNSLGENKTAILENNQSTKFTIRRIGANNFSGAVHVPINAKPIYKEDYTKVHDIYINMESSEDNPYFTYNPFYRDESEVQDFEFFTNDLFSLNDLETFEKRMYAKDLFVDTLQHDSWDDDDIDGIKIKEYEKVGYKDQDISEIVDIMKNPFFLMHDYEAVSNYFGNALGDYLPSIIKTGVESYIVGRGADFEYEKEDISKVYFFCPEGYEPIYKKGYTSYSDNHDNAGINFLNGDNQGLVAWYDFDNQSIFNSGDAGLAAYSLCKLEDDLLAERNSYNIPRTLSYTYTYYVNLEQIETITPVQSYDSECLRGGVSADSDNMRYNFDNSPSCILDDIQDKEYSLCDAKTFSEELAKLDTGNFIVALANDNYSEDIINFLENTKNYTIVYRNGNLVEELGPGIYAMQSEEDGEDFKLTLSLVGLVPDRFEHYFPAYPHAQNKAIGSCIQDGSFGINNSEGVPNCSTVSAKHNYNIITPSFRAINTDMRGLVLKGDADSGDIIYSNIKECNYSLELESEKSEDYSIDSSVSGNDYDVLTNPIAWRVNNNLAVNEGIEIKESYNDRIILTNKSSQKLEIEGTFYTNNDTCPLDDDDEVTPEGEYTNLQEIYNNGELCVIAGNKVSEYYMK